MFSKIYLGCLAASVALMSFFIYYSWSWIGSIGAPAAAVEGYSYHSGFAVSTLLLSSVVLLLLGNAVLWSGHSAWAMWTTAIYFAVFAILKFFWLDQSISQFKKANALSESGFSVGPVLAVLFVVIAVFIVFLNQFIVVRLNNKMYSTASEETVGEKEPEVDPPPQNRSHTL